MNSNTTENSEIVRLAQRMIDYLDALDPSERTKLLKEHRHQVATLQLVLAGALHDVAEHDAAA
jgi:hypothetical protein